MNAIAKKSLTVLFALSFLLLAFRSAQAGQYGYGEVEIVKKISLDKKVKHPSETTKGGEAVWVDNLFASQYLFQADQEVEFKITVTNISNQDVVVRAKDILPLDYLFTYDSKDFSVNASNQDLEKEFELKAGESKDLYFTAKVVSQDKLPQVGGYYCVLNTAQAQIKDEAEILQDQAQICIAVEAVTKGGLPVITEKFPETGPAENLVILFGSSILALTGGVLITRSGLDRSVGQKKK